MDSRDDIYESEYSEDVLDAPHALLSRIRASKEARGELRVQGAAGRKIIKDFSKVMTAEPGTKLRTYRSPGSNNQLGGYTGPGPSARDPQPLSGLIGRIIMERGWTTPLAVSSVMARWPELVGQNVAGKTTPESFDQGVLVVRCESTAWAVQIRHMKYDIMRRFNSELGDEVVTDIQAFGPHAPSWKKGRYRVPGGRGPRDTYG
ncbi:DUF721 domain-containing protein [Rothia nasimurium]|uniref:DUF721 domain-containing protein n=1 Tax=Rothia nasimurium TaxID=85336 RepID=UPI003BA32C95